MPYDYACTTIQTGLNGITKIRCGPNMHDKSGIKIKGKSGKMGKLQRVDGWMQYMWVGGGNKVMHFCANKHFIFSSFIP